MKKIKLYFSALLVGGFLVSCNSEADNLGLQFFEGDAASGAVNSYDLVVYNVNNGDEVRADSYALQKVALGAFFEEQFGGQKASYVTQVRLFSYAPSLGTNPKVDSVVVELKPEYYTDADSITTSTASKNYNGIEGTQTLKTYKTIKYGKAKKPMTIKVREVIENLGTTGTELMSSKVVAEGEVLGTKAFDGKVTAVNIVGTTSNTTLLAKEAGIRITLDKDFFQNKIASKNGLTELSTEADFINHFKGLKFYVEENDGYLINFSPDAVVMTMHYSNDASKNNQLSFNLGVTNVHLSQIAYNRSTVFNNVMANIDKINGDKLLYLQGMGGSGAGVKLSGPVFETLKSQYQQKQSAIISAKIRLYTDTSVWNNSYAKPSNYLVKEMGSKEFLKDLTTMLNNARYSMVTAYAMDSNPAHYDIDITKTVKDIVEQGGVAKDLVINVGDYLRNAGHALVNEAYNNNVFSPNRVVLVGSDVANENRAKLIVTSVTK